MRNMLYYIKLFIVKRKFFRACYSAGPIGGMGFTMKSGEGKEVKRS